MKLLVLDGNSILNRAYYGVKLLTTQDGRPTNGIVGFMNIYLSLRAQAQPEAVAIAFDVKAPTFRHKLYDGYKAQRKGMPEELAQQLPVLKELLAALGLCVLEAPGWEADDILGTLAAAADDCVLATGDRDALQLVSGKTQVWLAATKAGRPETRKYTPQAVQEEYHLSPAQLIDLKALMGDSSDNIPGVAGVGQITAGALLAQFGTLDALYDKLSDPTLKPALQKKLQDGKAMAYLSRTLGTIKTDAPVPLTPAHYVPQAPDAAKVSRLLAELEMFKLLERLELPEAPAPAQQPGAPRGQREAHDFAALLQDLRAAGRACFIPAFAGDLLEEFAFVLPEEDVLALCGKLGFDDFCKALLEDGAIAKYTINSKQLWRWCLQNGVAAQGIAFDAALAGYLMHPGSSDYSAARLQQAQGCGNFAALCAEQEKTLRANGQYALLQDAELPLSRVLAAMELRGVAVDAGRLARFGSALEARLQELEQDVKDLTGQTFNLNSPKQLGAVLFEQLHLKPPKKTKTGNASTSAETLEGLRGAHPAIAPILEYRTVSKLKSTYCDGLQKQLGADGRIHSSLNQTDTRTGRISSSEPNLQNIPIRTDQGRELRRCFAAPPGWVLVDADYSQIELRVFAALAGEEAMLQTFRAGGDIHTRTAAQVFNLPEELVNPLLRSRAKRINFGILYGLGAFSLAKDLGVAVREAQEYIDAYFARYPAVAAYRAALVARAKDTGYAETLFGRRRPLPELQSAQRQLREFGERAAVNMPVQGTAADLIKLAMVHVFDRLAREGGAARLLLQVHDELILEAPAQEAQAAAAILKEEMERAAQLPVPLEAQVHWGANWDEAHG